MIAEARGRQDLVILVAGAAVGLDVSELDGPAQVQGERLSALRRSTVRGSSTSAPVPAKTSRNGATGRILSPSRKRIVSGV